MRRRNLLALPLVLAAIACGEPEPSRTATTATSTATPRLDERLEDAAATAAAKAREPRFDGEILGIYVAPSVDDWPQELRDERERTISGGCENKPTGQSHFDFMRPFTPPDGWEPAGYFASTGNPEVVACGGRTTGINWEFARTNADGTPASVLVTRGVTRAETFDAAESDVSGRTVGARQAVVIRAMVPDAPGRRSMVLFPEDFGMTAIYTFNVSEEDLLAFAEAVAAASAPYWEVSPDGTGDHELVRVCAEIPPDAISHQAAFGFTSDERTSRFTFNYFVGDATQSYDLVLFPGDALDGCDEHIRQKLAFGHDPALFDAARSWIATQNGELAGECQTRPLIVGLDDTLFDWCYYRPYREIGGDIWLTVGRSTLGIVPTTLVLRPREAGAYDLVDVAPPGTKELQLSYFHDENVFRWNRVVDAASYRLRARLVAGREHAGDPCAAPPLEEETREIAIDEKIPSSAYSYAIDLPQLPPQDAWYVAINGTGSDATISLQALDAEGNIIDQSNGLAWVRDLFCVRPRGDD